MEKINKIVSSLFFIIGFSTAIAQNNKQQTFETNAHIEKFCKIETNDVNFGLISLPLTAQSANSQINILCSNQTQYSINLAYGGVYGSGSGSNTGRYFKINRVYYPSGSSIDRIDYEMFNTENKKVAEFQCHNGALKGITLTAGYTMASLPKCIGYKIEGWTGDLKSGVTDYLGGNAYSYGVMKGILKGDDLAYSISIPNDNSKVWNNGNYAYNATGTGNNQPISINAKIVPNNSSSKYIAADSYLDTVTATISY